jgi:hypothetical protein
VDYSLDREPWRAFRSSLAVQFTSRRRGGWSADQLTDQAKAEIISGLEARSAIIRSYSRIQSLVRDLVAKAGFSRQSAQRAGTYSAGTKEVLDYARSLAGDGGLLAAGGPALKNLFDRVEATASAADLIVRGFVEVREERSGAILFRLQQGGKRQSLTSSELKVKAVSLEFLSREAESQLASAMAAL